MSEPTPEPAPTPAPPEWWDDDIEDDEDEDDGEEDCGRWRNGTLSDRCLLAGTEWCDWECPLSWRTAERR